MAFLSFYFFFLNTYICTYDITTTLTDALHCLTRLWVVLFLSLWSLLFSAKLHSFNRVLFLFLQEWTFKCIKFWQLLLSKLVLIFHLACLYKVSFLLSSLLFSSFLSFTSVKANDPMLLLPKSFSLLSFFMFFVLQKSSSCIDFLQ